MAKYCITAARPKNATQHLKSEFKLWMWEKNKDGNLVWRPKGWKRAAEIATLLDAGNQVLTAKENEDTISTGVSVELELRIAKNETKYKISDMPDE